MPLAYRGGTNGKIPGAVAESSKNALGLMAFWNYQITLERSEVEKGQSPDGFLTTFTMLDFFSC